jgi:hypothetical protein
MTVWKQRFFRWNFLHIYCLGDNLKYLIFAWRLGRYEIMTKFFVFADVYATLTYLVRPFMLPSIIAASPKLSLLITGSLFIVDIATVCFLNAFQLRRKKEMVSWQVISVYFLMKLALTFINTFSIYYQLYAYAEFFSHRHPRVTESYSALNATNGCIEKARRERDRKTAALVEEKEDEIPVSGERIDTVLNEKEKEIHVTKL